jgi:hypothetical protein
VTLHIEIRWTKVKTCRFGSAKWFWPSIILHNLLRLVRAQQSLTPARENSVILFSANDDWSKWFAISSLPPICRPSFSFIDGKRWITNKAWVCQEQRFSRNCILGTYL